MKKTICNFGLLLLLAAGFSACHKDYGNHLAPLQDSVANIPVTVTNQVYFERFPVVTTTVGAGTNANGTFSIEFSIPADKGKIKEITKVATGNGGVEYLQSSSYPNYLTAAVTGTGTNTITFSSDLNAVRSYVTRLNAAFATLPATATKSAAFAFTGTSAGGAGTLTPNTNPQTPNQLRFFFLITLEDGTQLITTEVDVRLL
ncbi:hypothetical protein QMK33_02305 [Hymenobacter sp. H14-R3]|uniref:hypothetical protein n=1 Tax=Hymenobacter sp. H14-R3 TaxID=3046308 RepID=UPI0024BB5949|nr:hypothetical protein [Hymenobacter sp. H14-R3]MDJ0363969.1 hypothetical protein [Hymenobacter sp. H14-R3]